MVSPRKDVRLVTILPEGGGRVEEIFVKNGAPVSAGDPLFSLLDSSRFAAVNVAKGQLNQLESAFSQTKIQLEAANATLGEA